MTTYIVLVNWNGWRDTIECLESVARLRHPNFQVVLCDNGSADDSVARIDEWTKDHMKDRFTLLRSDKNLGFAGGNNIALHYILEKGDHDYVWLLNNDTVVDPGALSALVERMKEDPEIGICGSRVIFYFEPSLIQVYGGSSHNPLTGKSRHIGGFHSVEERESRADVEKRLGYVYGASMLVSRRFLADIGMMNEEYFLSYEEIDWATRAKGRFKLGYAPGSRVFHKQGRSSGYRELARNRDPQESYLASDFLGIRNQLLFTRRYYPHYVPFVMLTCLNRLLKRVGSGKWERARAVVRGMAAGFNGKPYP
ncbi:MAG TPA: glycosyltransferase family 2 protein [Candidatus Angelobacter sp.]|nr:glycosyltransferase family 2 protein [Candidatus Angelobacter sp.]